MVEQLTIDDTITVPIHAEILQTLKDDLQDNTPGDNLEVIQYCKTATGEKLIQYVFVPNGKLDGE